MHFIPTATRQTKTSVDLNNWPQIGRAGYSHPSAREKAKILHLCPDTATSHTSTSNAVALACRQIVLADLDMWPRMGPSPPSSSTLQPSERVKKVAVAQKCRLARRSACPQALKRLRAAVLQLQFATFCNSELTHLCSAPPLFYGIIEDDLKKRLINQEHDNKSIELKSHFDKQPKEVFSWMTLVLYYYTIHILKVGIWANPGQQRHKGEQI